MVLNIANEIAALQRMTVRELRVRYAEVFQEETCAGNKLWLVRRIAWRLQSLAEGDLSERVRQRAAELANDADVRVTQPKQERETVTSPRIMTVPNSDSRLPSIGSVITRQYKGRALRVIVVADGFEYEGERYPSLSAVAKAISGSHCNGFRFFNLEPRS